jgi:hypothetical protein
MESEKTNDENFINLLMEETYQSISDDEFGKSSAELLQHYNEQSIIETLPSIEEFIKVNKCSVYDCQYSPTSSCFRFRASDMLLDFPSNWSFFQSIKEAMDLEVDFMVQVGQENDPTFYEVLNKQFFDDQHIILAHMKGEVFFLALSSLDLVNKCLDVFNPDSGIELKAA